VADSACTATAYLCGIKIDVDTLGLDVNVIKKIARHKSIRLIKLIPS
jgi:alkaline phosphatase